MEFAITSVQLKISGVLFQAKEKELVDFEIFHSHLFLFYCVCLFSSITYACQIHQKHTSAAYILSLMRCSDPVWFVLPQWKWN